MLKIDVVWQGETQQKIFRQLLHCMSLPGEVADIGAIGECSALLGVLASLADKTVSLSDEDELLKASERSLLQASPASPETAKFVVKNAAIPPQTDFCPNLGELPSPEKGATLILQGKALGTGDISLKLSGAGVKGTRLVGVAGFHSEWFQRRQEWVQNFPLGVDAILVDSTRVMALPRTTQLQLLGGNYGLRCD